MRSAHNCDNCDQVASNAEHRYDKRDIPVEDVAAVYNADSPSNFFRYQVRMIHCLVVNVQCHRCRKIIKLTETVQENSEAIDEKVKIKSVHV